MKKEIHTDNAPAAIGPYSQAILANNTVYCSGQIPADPVTGEFPESVEEQTAQCLKNLAAVLEAKLFRGTRRELLTTGQKGGEHPLEQNGRRPLVGP